MDCACCKTRGAVESCSQCHTLLCEVCLIKCERCGKVVCPDHVHKTSSGRIICMACQAERKAKAKQREIAADADSPDVPAVEEEAPEAEILVASVRKPPPPWKLSVYSAGIAILLALVLFVLPSLRSFKVGSAFFSAAYPFLIIPAVSLLWAVVGIRSQDEDHLPDRQKCMLGAGLAVLAGFLLIFAALTDPTRLAEKKAIEDQKKSLERPASERRENLMNRFSQPEQR